MRDQDQARTDEKILLHRPRQADQAADPGQGRAGTGRPPRRAQSVELVRRCVPIIDIRVIPRAPRTRVDGTRGGAILIRLAAPPVDGAANDALIAFLSDALGLPRREHLDRAGEKSRDKRVQVVGLAEDTARARLLG